MSDCQTDVFVFFFFFQAEDGIRDRNVTGVQTCALPISTDGARDAMSKEQMERINKVASEVVDCMEVGKIDIACEVINEAAFDADEKVALWTFFDSKIRSALDRKSVV